MMFTEIVDTAIGEGGTVFGGYVRDFLRHENSAKKFYEALGKKEDYSDASVSPDTLDRLLIPSDIDVHFRDQVGYKKFVASLRDRFYNIKAKRASNMYTEDSSVHHIKLQAKPGLERLSDGSNGIARELILQCISRVNVPSVEIDVLISATSEPPFNQLDFHCNGLVMTKDGIGLCSDLKKGRSPFGVYRTLSTVMSNIDSKVAVVFQFKGHRWEKMVGKGWEILGENVDKRRIEGEVCTLCLDDIPSDQVYRFSCCKASYHSGCMAKIITMGQTAVADTKKCPHCRQYLCLEPEEVKLFGENIRNLF
jgi:hypothetical protein